VHDSVGDVPACLGPIGIEGVDCKPLRIVVAKPGRPHAALLDRVCFSKFKGAGRKKLSALIGGAQFVAFGLGEFTLLSQLHEGL